MTERAALERNIDVAVLGGGPAGSATALALARHGYAAVVIERTDYKDVRIGETLPPAVQQVLAGFGVWDRFIAENHSPSFSIYSAWGRGDLYENDFIFNPYGSGWHVDRSRFDAMLALAAEEAGAAVYRDAQLTSCVEDSAGNWQIGIAWGDQRGEFQTRFLVDATGRASVLARQRGARKITHDHLVGIVSFFDPSSPETAPAHYTLLEAVDDGWWYSAALPDFRLVIAYMTDADLYARGSKVSLNYLQEQLQKAAHTHSRINSCTLRCGPLIFAANSSRMDPITGKNWLAVGDAATAFDPLSSQGVYKALESGPRAARSIEQYWAGNQTALRDYAIWAKDGFDDYLLMREEYYGREMRWANSLFWQRRQRKH